MKSFDLGPEGAIWPRQSAAKNLAPPWSVKGGANFLRTKRAENF